jgi:flagellar M-ring protein FliF
MIWSDYWGALSFRQRVGLFTGMALIGTVAVCLAVWLLRDPYVPLATSLNSDRLNELTRELDRAQVTYRVGESADAVAVPHSQLGKARAATEGSDFGVPPSVGLELFKEADFSTTDFAQRINYQRALQGELTRTIQTIAGVRSARVHVILADGGLFKRNAAKASAAVSVALQPGKLLTPSQVHGIQRLVAASVPQIKLDDVVVIDESGTSLTRAVSDAEGDLSSAQLDLKRQADQYLEGKLLRLLQDLVPQGTASLSVDTVLDDRQLRVTTEEPLGAHGGRDSERPTGVLVKERQSQHGRSSGLVQTGGDVVEGDSSDSEHEYSVGRRMEQTLSAPGSIKRVSVAVALQGAPGDLSRTAVEQLVVNAVGIDRSRGDSVVVLLLPLPQAGAAGSPAAVAASTAGSASSIPLASARVEAAQQQFEHSRLSVPRLLLMAVVTFVAALLIGTLFWSRAQSRADGARPRVDADIDVDAMAAKVRQWLNEGVGSGRA